MYIYKANPVPVLCRPAMARASSVSRDELTLNP